VRGPQAQEVGQENATLLQLLSCLQLPPAAAAAQPGPLISPLPPRAHAPGGGAGQAGAAPPPGPAAGAQPCRLRQAVADEVAAG